ncbi:hypothetical protein PSHT_01377 [Puccinia striiformis]|uniref:Uncharacterized protein n=1 Tax=Puccinia striiformis TaxID=27350 RepID=A0A2S4WKL5_9BASI|nr:hypothetical protein PSHT_01377 [Puccinia striiformis]
MLQNESFEEWDSVWRTNVSGVFFTTVAFLPLLEKGGDNEMNYRSGVVDITSISGMVKISQNHFAYNASKAAAIHLTKMMACELANSQIRFNSIAPGVFPSEMTAKKGSDDRGKSDISESFDASKYKIPAGRPGRLQEMAASILYNDVRSSIALRQRWSILRWIGNERGWRNFAHESVGVLRSYDVACTLEMSD